MSETVTYEGWRYHRADLLAMKRALDRMSLAAQHRWLCHPNGEECPDGCDVQADPYRLQTYNAIQFLEFLEEESGR